MNNTRIYRGRSVLCLVLVLLIFTAYGVRLYNWQIVHGEEYQNTANGTLSESTVCDGVRGEILTADGKPLAVNSINYRLTLRYSRSAEADLNSTIAELVKICSARNEQRTDSMPIVYTSYGYSFDGEKENQSFDEAEKILNRRYKTAEGYISALARHYDCNISDKKLLRDVLSVRLNMDISGFSEGRDYLFAENISEKTAVMIAESPCRLDGVQVTASVSREYKNSTLAPHIVGAVGRISAEEYAEKSKLGYGYNDLIGKFGIEQALEADLRGKSEGAVRKNNNGSVVIAPEAHESYGSTAVLTLDSGLQDTANRALEYNVKLSHRNGAADCVAGAAVMLDISDFSVLAAATYPSYDLAKYNSYDYYEKLLADSNSPLYSRVFDGAFAPGSVFKPCVALAGLEEKKITPESYITCTQVYDYYPTDTVRCMGYHGAVNMNTALAVSCNYYFAELGRRIGREALYGYAEKLGLGLRTGVELPENMGCPAGRDSTHWMEGNTVQAAIGQSDNAFTPIQLAAYTATIANNGVRLRTHLVRKIMTYDRSRTVSKAEPEVLSVLKAEDKSFKTVQKGMRSVCSEIGGTAYSVFGDYPVKVAGKTGTAENSGTDHTVFICYAPYEKPQVAVAVVIEHGAYGTYSTAVAKALLDRYFFNKEYDPNREAVDEAGFIRH